ncbi:MAG TPA: radical SAM protein [Firmicutes bacterium]|nr:radical SAM protein [Bacillota bacterium]
MLRVSLGTAGVLGLRAVKQEHCPTTAYLMDGEKCLRDCAFCPQARRASSRADLLSRVTWPEYPLPVVQERLKQVAGQGEPLRRACIQVVQAEKAGQKGLEDLVRELATAGLPVCVSCFLPSLQAISGLLAAGADGVTLPLDAASEEAYRRTKGGTLPAALVQLERAARAFPGRIGTHLIVGLGESEQAMVQMLQLMQDWGVRVGLFAFTPVPGTRMAAWAPPSLDSYRRLQAAHYFIRKGLARGEEFSFRAGRLVGFGPRLAAGDAWQRLLGDGEAFRTTGCSHCNRPYYNERPGTVPYNFPRPLQPQEAARELERLASSLGSEGRQAASV